MMKEKENKKVKTEKSIIFNELNINRYSEFQNLAITDGFVYVRTSAQETYFFPNLFELFYFPDIKLRNALLPIEFKPQWKELGICCAKTFSNVPKWKAKERCHEVMK